MKVGSKRYRMLASEPLPAPKGVQLAILTPQSRIDAAVTAAEGRLFVPLLIELVLIALLAYVEGRSIVRTLGGLVEAARGIAQGKLDERVPVKGRDEFAQLGRAFNEMAAELHGVSTVEAHLSHVHRKLGPGPSAPAVWTRWWPNGGVVIGRDEELPAIRAFLAAIRSADLRFRQRSFRRRKSRSTELNRSAASMLSW